MLDAKLPPPRPAVAATTPMSQNGVVGYAWRSSASSVVGMSSSAALTIVQLRPPEPRHGERVRKRMSAPMSSRDGDEREQLLRRVGESSTFGGRVATTASM